MKQESLRFTRAALLMSVAALLATPALAQQTAPAAPQDQAAAPAAAAPAPEAAAPQTAAAPATPPVVEPQAAPATPAAAPQNVPGADPHSTTPIAPSAAQQVIDDEASRQAAARQPRPRTATRSLVRTAAPAPTVAPPRAAPQPSAATPAPAPITAAAPAPVAAAPAAAPTTPTAPATTQQAQTVSRSAPLWPFVLLGLVVIAGIAGVFAWRRRREADAYDDEPVATDAAVAAPLAEPVFVAEPTAAAAVTPSVEPVAEEAAVVTPEELKVWAAEAEDVAAVAVADAPVADRPWLEFGMRPLRAGTSADEALVEIELTVANAGAVAASDVRISTFMLRGGEDDAMDRLLTTPPSDATADAIRIDPGEGAQVDATLVLPRAELNGAETFSPVVVADARYRLPDGSEARLSASFVIGSTEHEGSELQPLPLAAAGMRDDVEARLYREPQRV